MNKLKCENCGVIIEHMHINAICTKCGCICKKIPLVDNEFENITDMDIGKKKTRSK